MKALLIRLRTITFLLLFTMLISAVLGEKVRLPSAIELEQAFAILDKMIPPRESIDMKDAPPNGEVVNPDGSHYTFNPMLYVPSLGNVDFSDDIIARLAKNHSRVMTEAKMKSLPKEGPYRRVIDGRSYLPCVFAIKSITQMSPTSAEALITTGGVGAGAEHRVTLELTAGQWTVKERKVLTHYD